MRASRSVEAWKLLVIAMAFRLSDHPSRLQIVIARSRICQWQTCEHPSPVITIDKVRRVIDNQIEFGRLLDRDRNRSSCRIGPALSFAKIIPVLLARVPEVFAAWYLALHSFMVSASAGGVKRISIFVDQQFWACCQYTVSYCIGHRGDECIFYVVDLVAGTSSAATNTNFTSTTDLRVTGQYSV